MLLDDLETPAVLIDLDVMERNLVQLADYTRTTGVALRPHIKTHKIPAIALRQIALGAVGIAAAKPTEAEVMADAGVQDIMLAYPVVAAVKANRLARLAERTRISVSVDSREAAECVARSFHAAGRTVDLLVEIDVGFSRCGVQSAPAAAELALLMARLPGAEFAGIMFYPGHMMVPPAQQEPLLREVNARVEATYAAIAAAGLPIARVSGGSTPMAYRSHEFSHITEIRPGMYPLNDRNLVQGGFATLDDCALTVMTSVVSTAVPQRVILDAGSKTFSSDRLLTGDHTGHGTIVDDADALLFGLSEEHGHVDIGRSSHQYRIGERLRVVPNHVCATINLHDRVYGIRGQSVECIWDVAARGHVQ
jgi:D-serine deaminase-like pyridoxal phosphate-dependent protein